MTNQKPSVKDFESVVEIEIPPFEVDAYQKGLKEMLENAHLTHWEVAAGILNQKVSLGDLTKKL